MNTEERNAEALIDLADIHSVGVCRWGTTVTATCGDSVEVRLNGIDLNGKELPGLAYPSSRVENRRSIRWYAERPCFQHDPAQQELSRQTLAAVNRWGSE